MSRYRRTHRGLPLPNITSIVIAVAVMFLLVWRGTTLSNESAVPEPTGTDYGSLYDVVRVVDGDTLVADVEGEEIKIRLIGVNTPESVHEDDSKNVPEGKDASAYMDNLLKGRKIYLVYDEDREDDYGRTLAYVYTEDFEFVNLLLVEEGLAECMRIEPNVRFASDFAKAESAARAADKGFWTNGAFAE